MCDTFVCLPPATAPGCVIFGKNSDRPDLEIQEVIYIPAATHSPGDKLQCTYIEIEQVVQTHSVILSRPPWMWGAEMGANNQGVCIGNEAVWTKLNSQDDITERLLGMDLLRLGLERGGTARESLDVMTSLLSQYGQGGTCLEGGEWAYHNSFIITDGQEAWVLETAKQYWVAEQVTEGVRNISNQLSITTKFDLSSPDLVENAQKEGLYNPASGPFNFAEVFDSNYQDPTIADSYSRFCSGRKLLTQFSEKGNFSLQDMMTVLRDEDSGINMEDRTRGSQVSMLPSASAGASPMPACHWFTATPNPAISMFKPFIFCPSSDIGKLTSSPDFGTEDPRKVKPRFQKKVDRRHDLFKGHENFVELIGKDDPKSLMISQNLKELESNCIQDVEEVLKNFNESSYGKVSQLFQHMCDIEMNFYK